MRHRCDWRPGDLAFEGRILVVAIQEVPEDDRQHAVLLVTGPDGSVTLLEAGLVPDDNCRARSFYVVDGRWIMFHPRHCRAWRGWKGEDDA